MVSRVKGTQDILDLRLTHFVLSKARAHMALHNFAEIETPILEHTKLFLHTLGAETDVVTKEMYTFKTAGGEEICLRPEATAPTMRAFLEANITETPWRVFSYGSMFRHERPQKGRWRQFSQLNLEIINAESIAHDAQLIAMLDRFFTEELLLKDYVLKVNFLGTKEERAAYRTTLHEFLEPIKGDLCKTCLERKEKNILRIFDCKVEDCQKQYRTAPKITDHLNEDSQAQWKELQDLLSMISVSYVVDHTLVRGLDYYNNTVFEFSSDKLGAQNAFCGGGRYDDLATIIGAKKPYPSLGSAIGISRLLLLVEKIQDQLPVPQMPPLHLILPMSEKQHSLALLLAYELYSHNLSTDILLEGGSMKSMMRKANKMGAKYVLILGNKEQESGTIALKNMISSEDKTVKQSEIIEALT